MKILNAVGSPFQRAGGTGTAITLTGVSLTDLFSVTFVAIEDNNSAATTVNGIPLYKPGTTTAPKIVSGRAYTIWYDQTGNRFFVKASGGGGTAQKVHVASTVTFTSDNADEEFGDMQVLGSEEYPGWRRAEVSYPSVNSRIHLHIPLGAYLTGAPQQGGLMGIFADDPNFVSANIPKGKSMFGLNGALDTEIYNFPLSVQDAQPTPVRSGHIWIKTTQGSLLTAYKIVEALNAGVTDGTVQLVVGDLAFRYFEANHGKLTTDGVMKSFSIVDIIGSMGQWIIQSIGGAATAINKPFVYSKIGGILDVENAYLWDGTSWIQLSQRGIYFGYAITGTGGAAILNKTNDEYVQNKAFASGTARTPLRFTNDGTYVLVGNEIYKRVGDVFSLYYTIPTSVNYVGTAPYFTSSQTYGVIARYLSGDGQTLVVMNVFSQSGITYPILSIYKNNGSTFVLSQTIQVGTSSMGSSPGLYVNSNGTLIICTSWMATYYSMYAYFKNGASYTTSPYVMQAADGGTQSLGTAYFDAHFHNGYLYMIFRTGPSNYNLVKYSVDYVGFTVPRIVNLVSTGIYQFMDNRYSCVSPDGYLYAVGTNNSLRCYSITEGVEYTLTLPTQLQASYVNSFNAIAISLNGDRIAISKTYVGRDYVYTFSMAYNTASKIVTLTLINTLIDVPSAQHTYLSFAPNND